MPIEHPSLHQLLDFEIRKRDTVLRRLVASALLNQRSSLKSQLYQMRRRCPEKWRLHDKKLQKLAEEYLEEIRYYDKGTSIYDDSSDDCSCVSS
uniref:Uncharacterized protein n=1 Tax=Rhodnius prolixus TaxID=13249 RepID=T1I2H1_RHOPR